MFESFRGQNRSEENPIPPDMLDDVREGSIEAREKRVDGGIWRIIERERQQGLKAGEKPEVFSKSVKEVLEELKTMGDVLSPMDLRINPEILVEDGLDRVWKEYRRISLPGEEEKLAA